MLENKNITIGIADEHAIFRRGIIASLQNKADINILWEADNMQKIWQSISQICPDIILLNLEMEGLDGSKFILDLKKECPDLKIIVISDDSNKEFVATAMEYGANAFLSKTTDLDEIYSAINGVKNDDYFFNSLVNNVVLERLLKQKKIRTGPTGDGTNTFTKKEMAILQMMSEDKSTAEIADAVYLSPRTVETIRQNIKAKAGVNTIGGLIGFAFRNRLINL